MRRLTAEERAIVPASRLVRRARRMHPVAASTEYCARITPAKLARLAAEQPESALTAALRAQRPRTRGECADGQRPCPWVSCRHHLYLDVVGEHGSIKRNFPDLEPWQMAHTCALDVADLGGRLLEQVGELMNMTRERVRQVETIALARVVDPMREHAGPNADPSRVLNETARIAENWKETRARLADKRKEGQGE